MQSAIGTIAEYNPFHNGHLYSLTEAKSRFDKDTVFISVMSGDFVQRGEPAFMNKHARAEAACACGVDIVVELPVPWSILSAERFAMAGVYLLNAMKVRGFCFGTETDDIAALNNVADYLSQRENINKIVDALKDNPNFSFAEAREVLVDKETGLGRLLEGPNNILAVEYLKAIKKINPCISAVPILRRGAEHDSVKYSADIKSASLIREEIVRGISQDSYIPAHSDEICKREITDGRCPVTMNSLELQIMSRLTMLSCDTFDNLPDSEGGAGKRLFNMINESKRLDSVLEMAKTKRYTLARMKRLAMCAALGITKKTAESCPPYIRILACDEKGRRYLRDNAETFGLPVITKPAHINKLTYECRNCFELNSKAEDFYTLAYKNNSGGFGTDYRTGPAIIDN